MPSATPPVERPLERRKARTRDAVIHAAHALLRAQGYEATTVDQIAAGAGISRRTFFRYFPGKDAVVFPHADERIARFRALLQPAPGESPLDAVRRACLELAHDFTEHRDELLLQRDLVAASPVLLAREIEIDRRWEAALADALAESSRTRRPTRHDVRRDDRGRGRGKSGPRGAVATGEALRARVVAAALAGALRAVLELWYESRGRLDLVTLGGDALDALGSTISTALAKEDPTGAPKEDR